MDAWLTWIFALMQTTIHWLNSMVILDIPVLWLIGAFFLMGVMFRAFLFKV